MRFASLRPPRCLHQIRQNVGMKPQKRISQWKRFCTTAPKNERRADAARHDSHMSVAYYMSAIAVFIFGLSYASVPLYKVFCQMTGFGGTTQRVDGNKASTVHPVEGGKIVRVDFSSNVHSTMPWKFKPTQASVKVVPGETALAFYTVKNPSSKAITGVATYNVYPPKAGLYFSKIQVNVSSQYAFSLYNSRYCSAFVSKNKG